MKRKKFKERYDFICAKCGEEMWIAPSMMMTQFGLNQGHGSCLKCKTFLHLEITPDIYGEEMISQIWDEWLKDHNQQESKKRSEGSRPERMQPAAINNPCTRTCRGGVDSKLNPPNPSKLNQNGGKK